MKKNEGSLDRLLRGVFSVIFFVIGFVWMIGILQIVFFAIAAMMLLTAITGFCGFYTLLKIDTSKYSLCKKCK